MRKTLLLLKNPWQFLSLSLTLHNPRVSHVDRDAVPSGAFEVHSPAISLAPSQLACRFLGGRIPVRLQLP